MIMITVQSSACWCPWWSLSLCPTGPPMTATGRSTKAALRAGRQEPRTGGAMQGPLVKYPSAVSCKYLSHSADSSIACFSDESVKLTLQDPTDIVIKSVSYSSQIQF